MDIRNQERRVLDHGFVRVVDTMGDDAAIVQAARTSYGQGTKAVNEDRGLIRYLMRHWHSTPFEMCEIKLHVKLPVFVARQWIRHRTANVNEMSARYSVLDREFYIPEIEHIKPQSTSNKQGREGQFTEGDVLNLREHFIDHSDMSYNLYSNLNDDGVARELSRMVLPVNVYTQWYWKVDLHNLFHFLRLRADPHAQYEIRVYADAICEMVKDWVPFAYEAFEDYRLKAVNLSRMEVETLRRFFQSHSLPLPASLSDRELAEFKTKLGVS